VSENSFFLVNYSPFRFREFFFVPTAPYYTEGTAKRATSKVTIIQLTIHRNLSLKFDFLAIIS